MELLSIIKEMLQFNNKMPTN